MTQGESMSLSLEMQAYHQLDITRSGRHVDDFNVQARMTFTTVASPVNIEQELLGSF